VFRTLAHALARVCFTNFLDLDLDFSANRDGYYDDEDNEDGAVTAIHEALAIGAHEGIIKHKAFFFSSDSRAFRGPPLNSTAELEI
jgi:hypothetical protein